MTTQRELVIPGELLDDSGDLRAGSNTYTERGAIYASRLGLKTVRRGTIDVIALSGRYDPQRGDMVIGTIVEVGPSNWYIDIGAPSDVSMHVNDVPWRVDFGETSKYLNAGDAVLLRISHVDELKKVQVTMKDRQCRKLTGGLIISLSPVKVPRIIGRGGSMISLLKGLTNTRMLVGQNGAIWIDGDPNDVALAMSAVRKIEREAHMSGLTERMKAWLIENGATGEVPEPGAEDEDEDEERDEASSDESDDEDRDDRGDRRGGGRGGDRGGGRGRGGGGGGRGRGGGGGRGGGRGRGGGGGRGRGGGSRNSD